MADTVRRLKVRTHRTSLSGETSASDDEVLNVHSQTVSNITMDFFYRPKTISLLIFAVGIVVMMAFNRNPNVNREDNIASGLFCVTFLFLIVSLMCFPNGPYIRPHPLVWRVVFGISLIYLLGLTFILFQKLSDVRAMLGWLYPELLDVKPENKSWATNCAFSFYRLWECLDIYAFAHFIGWVFKALFLRHAGILWAISVLWEITELAFKHLLPNFAECWWDMIILDVLLCNGLGIFVGLFICRKLEMASYHWESVKDIHTTSGKIRRVIMQFGPESFQPVRWFEPTSTVMRIMYVWQLLFVWQISELNTFLLKHILMVPIYNMLNTYRLLLIGAIVSPSIKQYYVYTTDARSRSLGTQCWIFLAITLIEFLICLKFAPELFAKADVIKIGLWVIFQVALT
ncbi:uncharacterized protein TRIADDRAFT_33936 [Trichoplax adhaerens]|uniref:Phosphatidylserine synthase n=1 Tax=Trichoplax adhaerens TaxID=10228 RepID=B3SDH6_TRIAD|nr:hypothetical protein TRIADDRAFT_33936 [Trichoplax adhaerens]EDV19234.1 hypothetical protein TRIADDRAFT_33936 [Trichoplax adhaerens]|eukprot:XP_002118300.1 hypothetical protein TRIADDRAFT_33936 [Trichoplax adhaerens]